MKVGDKVNCERAMSGDKRFGGHVVQVSKPKKLRRWDGVERR